MPVDVSELDLPHLPVTDPSFRENPWPKIDAARDHHPWLARIDLGYFVHGYQAVKDLAYQDDKLSPDYSKVIEMFGVQGTPWAKFQSEQLLGHTSPKHRRIRMSVGDAFTPRNVNKNIDVIRNNAAQWVDAWAPRGRMDFVEFASEYPISVLCAVLGTGTEGIPRLKHSLETQTRIGSWDPKLVEDLLAGYHIMADFCDRIVAEREAEGAGGDGLLDMLIAAKAEGKIDAEELRYLLMILFPAGYDTSKNILSMTMFYMLDRPDAWKRCAVDRDYCLRVTDEILRFHSVATMKRLVTTALDYEGVHFPVGTWLFFGNSIVGRDPRAFENASEFNPDLARANRHLAFGRGAHLCLGQHLARIQIAEGLHAAAGRITNPRLAGELDWRPFLGVWGLETLPIEFDPA
jgi:cytochrome P450